MENDERSRPQFKFDPQASTWYFLVDDLRIIGGGGATLEEAHQRAAEAIAFALEDDECICESCRH